jgi:hypothetical protein
MRTGTTYEQDFDGPTPERAAIANGHLIERDIFDAPNSATRIPIGTGFRIATPVYKMHLDGRVGIQEVKAADKFYKDYNHGVLSHKVAGRYGIDLHMAGLGTGGTPLSQQEDDGHEEEFHIFHAKRYARACAYIGHKPTVQWLTSLVCEVPIGEPCRIPTLEEIGRAYVGYESRKHAMASGVTLIKNGLERLAQFYEPWIGSGRVEA